MHRFFKVLLFGLVLTVSVVLVFKIFGEQNELKISLEDRAAGRESSATEKQAQSRPNLTNEVAGRFIAQLFRQNPGGPELLDDGGSKLNIDAEATAEDMLASLQGMQKNTTSTVTVVVSEKDLRITADSSPERVKTYIHGVSDVLAKHLSDVQAESVIQIFGRAMEENNTAAVRDLISRHELAAAELKQVLVPASWLSIHKEIISFVLRSRVYLENFMAYNEDPVRSIIALTEYEKFFQEYVEFQIKFSRRLQKENLL